MTVFSDGVLNRSLFEELMPDIERPDAWSAPHGFLFDMMAYPTSLELSRQFLDAADQLVERVQRQECEDYRLAFPLAFLALYLYRYAIELFLKCALASDCVGHRLDGLADILQRRCWGQHGQNVPAWIMNRLRELAWRDPTSTAFRYAEPRSWMLDGAHVDLYHLSAP